MVLGAAGVGVPLAVKMLLLTLTLLAGAVIVEFVKLSGTVEMDTLAMVVVVLVKKTVVVMFAMVVVLETVMLGAEVMVDRDALKVVVKTVEKVENSVMTVPWAKEVAAN